MTQFDRDLTAAGQSKAGQSEDAGQTPAQIAARLDQDREDLAQSIEGLRERLSLDVLMDDALDFARENVAPYARALDTAVRANPLAAVLAGAGIAWLVLGRKSAKHASAGEEGPAAPLSSAPAHSALGGEDASPADTGWIIDADRLREQATRALDRIDAQDVHPADRAQHRTRVLADLAASTRAAMLRGLDGLGRDAQDRVLATRESAYAARIAVAREAGRLIEDRPLLAAGIGLAIGAAIGAALPGTATEDRWLGSERDRLLAMAKAALQRESDKAMRAGVDLASAYADKPRTAVDDSV